MAFSSLRACKVEGPHLARRRGRMKRLKTNQSPIEKSLRLRQQDVQRTGNLGTKLELFAHVVKQECTHFRRKSEQVRKSGIEESVRCV
eukprot:1487345-Amphidinium_carterae.1